MATALLICDVEEKEELENNQTTGESHIKIKCIMFSESHIKHKDILLVKVIYVRQQRADQDEEAYFIRGEVEYWQVTTNKGNTFPCFPSYI